ncbi:hypothetical protein, partial [Streptomyces rhizosphaerihabitans]|nr:hypothetical protein [Streptomyces rhizosphaerihabitans]
MTGGEIVKATRNWPGNSLGASGRSRIMFMDRDEILNQYVAANLLLPPTHYPALRISILSAPPTKLCFEPSADFRPATGGGWQVELYRAARAHVGVFFVCWPVQASRVADLRKTWPRVGSLEPSDRERSGSCPRR